MRKYFVLIIFALLFFSSARGVRAEGGFVFPLPGGESAYVKGTLSNGGKGFHCDETRICGWDFWRADHGTAEMLSAISGTVTEKFVDGVGNPVLVISNTDFETGYMHMDPIIVNIGEKVQSGQKIGMMGDIGQSTWTHLHFWAKNLKTGVFLHKILGMNGSRGGTR